jgi:hypothetical protein
MVPGKLAELLGGGVCVWAGKFIFFGWIGVFVIL